MHVQSALSGFCWNRRPTHPYESHEGDPMLPAAGHPMGMTDPVRIH